MSTDQSTHRFRFLVAGEIIFSQAGGDSVSSVRLNGMIAHTDVNLPARLIGKAQQILQMLFHKRMSDSKQAFGIAMPKLVIQDVVILNISPLGYMSEEDFNAPPESTMKQEKAKPNLKVVPSAADLARDLYITSEELHIIPGATE